MKKIEEEKGGGLQTCERNDKELLHVASKEFLLYFFLKCQQIVFGQCDSRICGGGASTMYEDVFNKLELVELWLAELE